MKRKSSAPQRVGRVHPQIAWAKLRALRDGRVDREKEVVELNSKVPVQIERNKKQEIPDVKSLPLCFP